MQTNDFTLNRQEHVALKQLMAKQKNLQAEEAELTQKIKAWGDTVSDAHVVDLTKFNIDLDSGLCVLDEENTNGIGTA